MYRSGQIENVMSNLGNLEDMVENRMREAITSLDTSLREAKQKCVFLLIILCVEASMCCIQPQRSEPIHGTEVMLFSVYCVHFCALHVLNSS